MAGAEAGKVGAPRGFRQSTGRTIAEIAILLVAFGALLLGLRGCAGWLAGAIVSQVPASVDATIGKAGGEAMRVQYGGREAPSPEDQARAARVFDELRENLTPEEAKTLGNPRLTVVRDPLVNAFALPGGEVFVLTGLLDRTKDDDGALRGVLAHELGHAVRRHGVRGLVRNSVYGLALAFLLGDIEGLTGTLVAGASQLDTLSHSREMEEEADEFGVDLLRRAGHDGEGLARFMESMETQPVPELLSTHPDPLERARAIRERIREREKKNPAPAR
jgi:Zn-dependent protease with chaperone function